MSLTLRACNNADLQTLVNLSRDTFIDAFEKDNDPEDFQAYLKKAFAPNQLDKELNDPDTFFYFVFDDNDLVGYCKLNVGAAQTDVHEKEAVELERIYVLGEHQGKQIGAWLLQEVVCLAKKWNKSFVWLGVWEHNPKAIRFYQRHGFTKFGEHPYYIGTDKQTDWLLRLDLQ